jgi:hypothetical protein
VKSGTIREIFWLLPVLSPLLPVVSHFSFVSTWKRSHFSLWFQISGSPAYGKKKLNIQLQFYGMTYLMILEKYLILISSRIFWSHGMGMIANAQFVLTFKVCFLPSIGHVHLLYVILSFYYCVACYISF